MGVVVHSSVLSVCLCIGRKDQQFEVIIQNPDTHILSSISFQAYVRLESLDYMHPLL